MPYIKKSDRERFDATFRALHKAGKLETPGELNYLFTIIINHYLIENGLCYQSFNDCLGALEGCKLELYRRDIAPYEDTKIRDNGDVK